MKTSRRDQRLTSTQIWLAGGVAGVIARTVTSPLEVVKIITQVGLPGGRLGFSNSFKYILDNEGLKGFWKGNLVGCLRVLPQNALQMGTYSRIRGAFQDPQTGRMTGMNSLLAGSIAGVVGATLTYPLDVVKTRLTVDELNFRKQTGIADSFKILAAEKGYFKGLAPSILGVIPFAATLYASYETIDSISETPKERRTAFHTFMNGSLAAAIAQTASYPFDTIKRKMQVQNFLEIDIKYTGMVNCFQETIRVNGFIGLWRGNMANVVRIIPYGGATFVGYEIMNRQFAFANGYTISPFSNVPRAGVDETRTPEEAKKFLRENVERGKQAL